MASLRRNISFAALANASVAAYQFLLVGVIANYGSTQVLGEFALAQSIITPVFMFSNLELRSVIASDGQARSRFGYAFRLRLTLSLLATFGIALFSWALIDNQRLLAICLALTTLKCVESLSNVIYGLMQHVERIDYVTRSVFIQSIASVLLLGFVFYFTGNLPLALCTLAAGRFVVFLFHDATLARRFTLEPQTTRQSLLSPLTLFPMGLTALVVALNSNIPRYFLSVFQGQSVLGQFTIIATAYVGAATISNAIGQGSVMKLGKAYAAGDMQQFRTLLWSVSRWQAGLLLAGTAGAIIAGPLFLQLCFGTAATALYPQLVALMLATATPFAFGVTYSSLIATQSFRFILPLTSLTAATTLGVSLVTIPAWGIYGAIAAIGLGGLPFVLGGHWVVWRRTSPSLSADLASNLNASGEIACAA